MIWYWHAMWRRTGPSYKEACCSVVGVVALSGLSHVSAHAIDVHPTAKQIQTALDQGKEAAQKGVLRIVLCAVRSNRRSPFQRDF